MTKAVTSVLVGVVLLFACGVIDSRGADEPWRAGFAYTGPVPDWPGVIPFVVTPIESLDSGILEITDHACFIDFSGAQWKSILSEGRVPDPGKREALAGVLCKADSFSILGETYTVTGRIRRDTACFSTLYAVPYNKSTATALLEGSAHRGFYDPYALERASQENFELPGGVEALFIHGAIPMPITLSVVILTGLALTTYGAAVLQWKFVLELHKYTRAFAGLVAAQLRHPLMFRNMLVINYAVFLLVMFAGLLTPRANFAASQWVFEIFSEGPLKELGAAYVEGNVLRAAWETFRNNFIAQTFIWSTLLSIVIPMWGVGKTLLSITVVGFAMAPIWAGSAVPMTYHWLTIAIELQAYILVSFGVCVYTVQAGHAIFAALRESGGEDLSPWSEFRFGFEALASATMYACFALAIAAIYEAVTLIGLNAGIAGQ